MRKAVLTIGLVLGIASSVFAQDVRSNLRVYDLGSPETTTTFTIPRNTVAYTSPFPIKNGEFFGLSYRFTSVATSPNIRMQLEQAYRLPDISNDADTYWVVPDNMADIATGVTTETQHHISLSPAPTPYARIKITEAGVSGDTQCTLKITVVGEGVNSN